MVNFIPWKGTNAITDPTKQLNAQYTSSATNGFAVGDTVTALSTNAALRMATLVSAAVAKIFNFDSMSIDSSLASVINKIKESDPSVFGTIFNSEMVFNKGAAFNGSSLTINQTSYITLNEYPLPNFDSSGSPVSLDYYYGLGNMYTISKENEPYARGLESKFWASNASYENRKYYKVAFHPFLDMISSGTTASETKSTIFDIQQLNLDSGKQGAVFYIRPNGQAMVNELLVLDGIELISTRKELSISFNGIRYINHSTSFDKSITWEELFNKLNVT